MPQLGTFSVPSPTSGFFYAHIAQCTALISSKLVGTQKFLRPRPDGPARDRMGFIVQWSALPTAATAPGAAPLHRTVYPIRQWTQKFLRPYKTLKFNYLNAAPARIRHRGAF